MKASRSVKFISVKRTKLFCHPKAQEAYRHSRSIRTYAQGGSNSLNNKPNLDVAFASNAQQLNPLFALRGIDKELMFFAGWYWYDKCLSLSVDSVLVIEYAAISELNPCALAWQYLLSQHLYDMHREDSLMQFVSLIEHIPKELRRSLFAKQYSSSSLKMVENITGESRQSIRTQTEKNTNVKQRTQLSILDELTYADKK
jgi:hypothetical protein